MIFTTIIYYYTYILRHKRIRFICRRRVWRAVLYHHRCSDRHDNIIKFYGTAVCVRRKTLKPANTNVDLKTDDSFGARFYLY